MNLDDAAMLRYRSHLDVSLDLTKAARFAIGGFSIVGRSVDLIVKYSPVSSARQIAQLAGPEWSFTLKGSDLWVEGAANGWTQTELFDILGHVALISERPDVLAEHGQEMREWKGH